MEFKDNKIYFKTNKYQNSKEFIFDDIQIAFEKINKINESIKLSSKIKNNESDYSDNRHPDKISWAKTLKEDLSRRDYTVNAMAYDNNKVIDLYYTEE